MLRRCPLFLRVTSDDNEQWDALDQLEDRPSSKERLFAYRLEGEPSVCFVRMTGGRGGRFMVGEYRLIPDQPADTIMRNNAEWVNWVRRKYATEPKKDAPLITKQIEQLNQEKP
jgi:hypothetical protein